MTALPVVITVTNAAGLKATQNAVINTTGASAGSIPLNYNDSRFSGNATSNSVTVSGGTLSKKSITDTGSTASVVINNSAIIDTCRVNSREAVRIAGSGADIRNCYLEATGSGADHADVIQTYSPGERGSIIKIKDTAIVAHNTAATAGLFVADNFGCSVTMDNVLFWGGPYGCRIHADPGCTVNVSAKDVFFVGPFAYGATLINKVGTGILNIVLWENVRNATIVNGVIVPGTAIARP
jgi:hypothetical protein